MFNKTEGDVLPGRVYVSEPGRLHYKCIIHAVGPTWRGGKYDEESLLHTAVTNAITAVIERGLSTVAIPAISTGSFNYPVEKATSTIVTAVVDALKESGRSSLKEVVFVDSDPAIVAGFEAAMSTIKPHEATAREESETRQKHGRHLSGMFSREVDESNEGQEPGGMNTMA